MIAELAERQLSEPARREAARLLRLVPGATLVSIATWADETRSPSTAPWNYVNLPRGAGCGYEPGRSCVQGACVVGAIKRQSTLLASEAADDVRLQALKEAQEVPLGLSGCWLDTHAHRPPGVLWWSGGKSPGRMV